MYEIAIFKAPNQLKTYQYFFVKLAMKIKGLSSYERINQGFHTDYDQAIFT